MVKEYNIFLGGEWRPCKKAVEIKNPYNDEAVGRVHQAGEDEIAAALRSVREGFKEMKRFPVYRRAEALRGIAAGIEKRDEDFAQMICREAGKPISDSRIEVGRAALNFRTAAEEATRIFGEVIPLDLAAGSDSRFGIVRRFPIGPVLGITPFNFPLNLVGHKVAPAIAAGNSILIKPAPQAPITALMLGEVIAGTDLPPGAVSVIPCGNDMAEEMVRSDVFKMVSFTGSVPVGWRLKEISGKKKVALELGGNAGVIIHSDTDLEYAARRCAVGGFSYSGQSCISVQRIYVQEGVKAAFLDKFIPLVKKLKTGDPASDLTNVGPLIDQGAAERTEKWVNEAKKHGAEVLAGGSRDGKVFTPTVLSNVTKGMKVCSEEAFAPLVTVSPYQSFEEAVLNVNDSNFGLQAGIFTNDMKNIFHAFEALEVGGVMVNEVPTYRMDPMPYGGLKDSGLGREGARYAIEEMTEPKLLAINP